MNNNKIYAIMGRGGNFRPNGTGGDSGSSPMGQAAPASGPGGAAASASLGGFDVSGRLSAGLLMGAVLFLGGVYVATRRVQL